MNQVELVSLLNSLDDIPSFYDHAPNGTRLPFMTIHITQPDNFAADNSVYCENWHFRIDLYTAEKNPSLEREIKELLNENGIFWYRTETYLDDQHVYEVEFEFDTYGDETEPDDEGDGEDNG